MIMIPALIILVFLTTQSENISFSTFLWRKEVVPRAHESHDVVLH